MPIGFGGPSAGGLSFGNTQQGNLSFKSDGSSGLSFGPSSGGGLSFGGGNSTDEDSVLGKVQGFGLSTLESFPELFGITPSDRTESYRAKNPVSGFVSQIAGAAVPYLGEAKLLEAIPLTKAAITAAESLGTNAFTRGALRAATETSMIEATRLGASATPVPGLIFRGDENARDQSLGSIAGSGAINVLGAGVLGGGLGALGATFKKGPSIQDLTGIGRDAPLLEQQRAIGDMLDAHNNPDHPLILPDESLARLTREQQNLARLNLTDVLPDYASTGEAINGGKYNVDQGRVFRDLVGEKPKEKVGSFLNKLTNWNGESVDKLTSASRPIVDVNGGLASPEARAALEDNLGMSFMDAANNAQNIRVVSIKPGTGKQAMTPDLADFVTPKAADLAVPADLQVDPSANPKDPLRLLSADDYSEGVNQQTLNSVDQKAKLVERRLTTGPFTYVGEGFYQATEKDGLHVMAKKLTGDIGSPAAGDQWAILRTDKPQAFSKQAAAAFDEVNKSAFFPERPTTTSPIGESTFDTLDAYLKAYGKDVLGKAQTKAGPLGAMLKDSIETAGSVLSPSNPLGTRNPLLNLAIQAVKDIESHVNARVDEVMHGSQSLPKGNLVMGIVKGPETTQGLDAAARALSQAERDEVQGILMAEIPHGKLVELNERGVVSPGAFNYLSAMQQISDGFNARVATVRQALTSGESTALAEAWQTRMGHYGLTRDFSGPYKVRIEDADGNLVGLAPGADPQAARQAAQELIEQEAKHGRVYEIGGLVDQKALDPDQYRLMVSAVRKPGFLKSRGNLIGYEYGRGTLTGPRLSEITEQNIRARENYLRDIAVWEKTKPLEDELRRTSPQDAQALRSVLERMGARKNLEPGAHPEGAFARTQNAIMDRALKVVGFSGGDSASKIVRVTQKTLSDFQFNNLNIMQPVQNMVGVFQTLLPEVAFNVHASPETLARHYVSLPLYGQGGALRGTMGVLDPVKILMNSIGHVFSGTPNAELSELTRMMVRRGVLAPRFAEEQFGHTGNIFRQWRDATTDIKSFVKLAEAANQFMVGKSEEINRLISVSAAYQLAKVHGISDFGQMVHFTQELIGKSNYAYGVADRAKVFTTPAGSLMGTFKNWQFHFMASMLKYATGGKEMLPSLFWQTAATGLFGGAVGMPFVMPVADGISKFLTNKKATENLYSMATDFGVPEQLADGVLYGLPGAMGVSLASSVSEPGADPARDASMIFSFAAVDRMKALGNALGGSIDNYVANGTSPFENDTVRDQIIRAVAPRTLFRTMQVIQDDSLRSLSTGNPIMSNVGLGDRALYAMGFNPTQLEKTYYAYNEIKDDQAAKKTLVKNLGEELSHALENNDGVAANRTYVRGLAFGVDGSRILRSAQSRDKAAQITQLEAAVKPKDRAGWEFAFPGEDPNRMGGSSEPDNVSPSLAAPQ